MENNSIENGQQENINESGNNQQEKMFTQEELNRIIGERLARVKTEHPELQEREKKCAQRELLLDARERLADAGLPKELLSAINCSTKEEMENSIRTIQSLYGNIGTGNQTQQSPRYRINMSSGANSSGSGHRSGVDDPEAIRQAMKTGRTVNK